MIALQETTPISVLRLVGITTGNDGTMRGLTSPAGIGRASHGSGRSVLMLGPGTCLILGRAGDRAHDAAHDADIVVEESGAWRLFVLEGERVFDLIGRFSPADLHHAFDACVATHAAGHPVIIMPRAKNRLELLVARSYCASLLALLEPALAHA